MVMVVMFDQDGLFFATHPDRFAHIRKPDLVLNKTVQRGTFYADECENEFRSLGDHRRDRRRIILWRMPQAHPLYDPDKPVILKIPFLLFSDETVEDTDEVLLPIVHEIMTDAAKRENLL